MNLRKRRRNRFKFTERTHSIKGMIACGVGVVLVILYIIFISMAFRGNGNLSVYFGSVGVIAMLASLVNLVITIQSMREEESFQLFPRIALVLTILAILCWIGTYAMGFIL